MSEEFPEDDEFEIDKAFNGSGGIVRVAIPRNTLPNKPSPIQYDRLTVVETMAFMAHKGTRVPPVESKYCRVLSHSDRPYQRTYKVGETPGPLDLGWAREWPAVGLIHVSNDEGKYNSFIPTPKEVQERALKIVELGDWLIYPGESMRGVHKDIQTLLVRCRSGFAEITITIFPA